MLLFTQNQAINVLEYPFICWSQASHPFDLILKGIKVKVMFGPFFRKKPI